MEERSVGSIRFSLDLSQPLYEQIVRQLSGAIARGDLMLGEKIPSVRVLAQALKITPNTVMRAFQELERDGLIETHRGHGTFVTASGTRVQEFRAKLGKEWASEILARLRSLEFSSDEIRKLIPLPNKDTPPHK